MGLLRKITMIMLLFGGFLWPSHLMAQAKIQASLNLTEGLVDDTFILTITIKGDADDFDIPKVPGLTFRKVSENTQITGSLSWGKMGTVRETAYGYVIGVEKPGTFTIPSIEVKIDGKNESTLPLTIVVKPNDASTQGSTGVGGKDIFIERSLSKAKVFVGEQLIVTNRIFMREELLRNNINQPDASHIKMFRIKGESRLSKVINGETYQVVEFSYIAVPQKAGALTLEPLRLEGLLPLRDATTRRRSRSPFGGMFDDIFSMNQNVKQVKASSSSTTIQVEALPTKDIPKNFTGLVGEFKLESKVSADEASTGDTVTVDISLNGTGYSEGAESLKPDFAKSLKVYPDQPQISQSATSEGFQSEQTFQFAVVPTIAGKIKIGNAGISYFDTKSKSYKELSVDLGMLAVTGASIAPPPDNAGATENKTDVSVTSRDLLPLHANADLLGSHSVSKFNRTVLLLLAALPWFLALFIGLKRAAGHWNIRQYFAKAKTPLSKLDEELTKAQDLVRSDDTAQGLLISDNALRQYLDVHADERRRLLLATAKKEIEASLYSGRKPNSDEALAMIQKAKDLVKQSEATL